MDHMKLQQMRETYIEARKLIINHIETANDDDIYIVREGYGFSTFECQSPSEMDEANLGDAFECFMHIFDFLDETTCQDVSFFELKDQVENYFFVEAVQTSEDVA
ncbi:hypothetical protein [Vibrio owensii]|uniref:hypothetical protein n=1 Tax=Vibrio harveyi group TaxID=717610 RepID=UPI003CC571F9